MFDLDKENYLKEEDKETLRKIIERTKGYISAGAKVELFLTGSSLADSGYNDIDLVVISETHEPKSLAGLVVGWIEEISPHAVKIDRDSSASSIEPEPKLYHTETCYPFDITAAKKLEEALVDRERKHVQLI